MAFSIYFAVELLLKMIGLGFKGALRDRMSQFDALVVVASLVEIALMLTPGADGCEYLFGEVCAAPCLHSTANAILRALQICNTGNEAELHQLKLSSSCNFPYGQLVTYHMLAPTCLLTMPLLLLLGLLLCCSKQPICPAHCSSDACLQVGTQLERAQQDYLHNPAQLQPGCVPVSAGVAVCLCLCTHGDAAVWVCFWQLCCSWCTAALSSWSGWLFSVPGLLCAMQC